MPSEPSDDLLLLIRCPSCGQRFKVGEDLREKTVECGGCEHRFRINEEVIVRGKKIYPGEIRGAGLDRFQRVPLALAQSANGPQPIRYGEVPSSTMLEPASPLRILAGAVGVAGMILMALLLMFGASRGGILDGMQHFNRLLMAGFAGLVGIVLLVYANPRARIRASLVGLLMTAGLLVLPFVFTAGSRTQKERQSVVEEPKAGTEAIPVENLDSDQLIRNQIGIEPLQKEIDRLSAEKTGKHAVGIWLRGLNQINRLLVRDYLTRTTAADQAGSHLYPREDGDYLMVVSGLTKSLEEVTAIVVPLGHIVKIYQSLSVIEVQVNNDNFTEGPLDKLIQKDDPAFYTLNKRELESIDPARVQRAVQRLAEAAPKVYRVDITRRLITLLGEDGIDFKGDICRALASWSEQAGPASAAAMEAIHGLMAKQLAVPTEMVALMVKEKNEGVIPILDHLWTADPTSWERLYGDVGLAAETKILQRFPHTEGSLQFSAVRLLGRVGGAASLPVLEAAKSGANPELSVLLDQAQKSIRERLAK